MNNFDCMYVCVPYPCSALGGQKRVSDLLVLELQMIVSHYTMGAGN